MAYIYTNRASAQLASPIDPDDTNMIVQTGQGVPFPVPSSGNVAQLTITAADGTHEIVTCTSRVGDNFVITRGQESTPAGTFGAGSRVELRLTAATLNSFMTKAGGQMTGPIDFNNQSNINFRATGGNSIEYLFARSITGYDGVWGAQIEFPGGGQWPKIQGSKLLTWGYLAQAIFIYYGGIEFLPAHLKICDGTRNTPDLRDKFVICAGPQNPQFWAGGDYSLYINGVGDHGHDAVGFQLESTHLPPMNALSKAFTNVTYAPGSGVGATKAVLENADVQGYSGVGGHHGHGVYGAGNHTHTGSYKPPYFSLYYVMLNESAFN